jgi:hypothetical protein
MKMITATLLLACIFLFSSLAYAEPVDIIGNDVCAGNEAKNSSVCQQNSKDPFTGSNSALLTIANILAWAGGVIAVIMIIFAGFTYVTSSGDDSKVKSAKNIILYAVVGLIVIVVSRIIVAFVIDRTLK